MASQTAPLPPHGVDFARGTRIYATSVDLIRAAPLTPQDTHHEFRFRAMVTSPGHWLPADSCDDPDAAFAELRATGPAGPNRFIFVCPDPQHPLVRAANYTHVFDPEVCAMEGDLMTAPLAPGVDFYEQLVEVIREYGKRRLPEKTWLIFSITGTPSSLDPVGPETELKLWLKARREHLALFGYDAGDGREGIMRVTPIAAPA